MKNNLSIKILVSILLVLIICTYISLSVGYEVGKQKGITITLDTVLKIVNKHVKLDTLTGNTAKLVIINPDTTIYVLNSKKLYK